MKTPHPACAQCGHQHRKHLEKVPNGLALLPVGCKSFDCRCVGYRAPVNEKSNEEWRRLTGPDGTVMQNWCTTCDCSYRWCQCDVPTFKPRFRGEFMEPGGRTIEQVGRDAAAVHEVTKP